MKMFFKSLTEGSSKIAHYLSNIMTDNERKITFFLLTLIALGAILLHFELTPTKKNDSRFITANRDSLSLLASIDFVMRYDLNKVTYDELLFINGIGPATATAIINHQQNVGFNSVEDLLNIRGIGARRLEEFKRHLFVDTEYNHNNSTKLDDNVIRNGLQKETETNIINQERIKININEATKEELMTLRGIGAVRAIDIIAYRTQHGNFARLEDIQNVRGIGVRTYENIKDFITLGDLYGN